MLTQNYTKTLSCRQIQSHYTKIDQKNTAIIQPA